VAIGLVWFVALLLVTHLYHGVFVGDFTVYLEKYGWTFGSKQIYFLNMCVTMLL
jgi:hypothetical protein